MTENTETTMLAHPGDIQSERLLLRMMSVPFLEASLAGDHAKASQSLGTTPPTEWWGLKRLMKMRLEQLHASPHLEPWLLRAVILSTTGEMIGNVGFHTEPDPDYLRSYAPGGIEMGYTIYPAFRQQGYATEAVTALMQWARQEKGVRRFVLSISPDNVASLRIAQHFDFHKVGTQMDDIDGPEDIFVLDVATDESSPPA